MSRFEGKRIVVAGAGSGIGAATAERLAREGARVIVGDINETNANEVAAEIDKDGGTAAAIGFDMADEESIVRLIQECVSSFDGIDGLANVAAAVSQDVVGADFDLFDMRPDVWEQTMRVNVLGFALTCREAIRHFVNQGTGGAIVNVSSDAANMGEATRPAYAASKAAGNALTRHIATRWGPDRVRCNSVAPGLTLTETAEERLPAEFIEEWAEHAALKMIGRPDDQAAAIAYLLSDDSRWVSGQVWHVNGGYNYYA